MIRYGSLIYLVKELINLIINKLNRLFVVRYKFNYRYIFKYVLYKIEIYEWILWLEIILEFSCEFLNFKWIGNNIIYYYVCIIYYYVCDN